MALLPEAGCISAGAPGFRSMGHVERATQTFRDNPSDLETRDVLNAYRRFRLNCIHTSLHMLKDSCLPDRVLVSARLKRLRSIYRKLRRSQILAPVNRMDDIIGFRVICETLEEVIALGSRVEDNLKATMKDYIKDEHIAGLGYRAIHGIARFDQPFQDGAVRVRFEIQIRTWYQHLWACWCESHGEAAKEGYPNVRPGDESFGKKLKLQDRSNQLRDWEDAYPRKVQKELPIFTDPYSVAIAWFNRQQDYGFDPFWKDITGAVDHLHYLESQIDVEPLLLVGIADSLDLKSLLAQTHPNFMSVGSLDPQFWLPNGAINGR